METRCKQMWFVRMPVTFLVHICHKGLTTDPHPHPTTVLPSAVISDWVKLTTDHFTLGLIFSDFLNDSCSIKAFAEGNVIYGNN